MMNVIHSHLEKIQNNNTFECNLNKNKLSSATPFYTTTPNNNNLPPNLKGKINYITYYKTNRSTYNYTEHINKFNDANNFIDISEKLTQMRTSPDLIRNQQYMKGFTVNECEELCSMVDECKSFAFDETAGDTCIFFSDNTIESNTVAEEWDLYVKN